jgi:hypothetical protein
LEPAAGLVCHLPTIEDWGVLPIGAAVVLARTTDLFTAGFATVAERFAGVIAGNPVVTDCVNGVLLAVPD